LICFETDGIKVTPGFALRNEPPPTVDVAIGDEYFLVLPLSKNGGQRLLQLPEQMWTAGLKLHHAGLLPGEKGIPILVPGVMDNRALVLVTAPPGDGGMVRLYDLKKGEVRLSEQGDSWSMHLIVLEKGGSFKVKRTGDLQGAPAKMSYRWYSSGYLSLKNQWRRRRQRCFTETP